MKTSIRNFHASSHVWQNNNHVLFPKINWDMVAAGFYAVVNPAPGGQAILYISQREMNKMVRVALSQDTSLIILASPGDTPPTSDQPSSTSPFSYKNSSRTGALLPSSWNDGRSWAVSELRSLCEENESGDISVPLTAETLSTLIPYWGHMASYRAGGPKASTNSLKVDLWSITKSYIHLLSHHGPQYVILRMKVSLFLMYRRLAQQPGQNAWLLGTPVGLATCGLPKIIPRNLRANVLRGDLRTIRILGTVFSGYKVFQGVHPVSDLQSVLGSHPTLEEGTWKDFQNFCEKDFWKIVASHAGSKWTTLKSPNFAFPNEASYLADRKQLWSCLGKPNFAIQPTDKRFIPFTAGPNHKVGLLGAPFDAIAWSQAPINWPLEWANAVGDTDTIALFNKTLKKANKLTDPPGVSGQKDQTKSVYHVGKISLLPEPAGKVRSIAIVDYWTQRLMHPVHKWMMDVLRCLPQDATFDQEGSLRKFSALYGGDTVYSIDLKSATDMIPQCIYTAVFRPILSERLTKIWMSLLTDRPFHIPRPRRGRDGRQVKSLFHSSLWGTDVRYNRGQPMGTLSSWASMAIVHHAIELYSAKKAGIDPFTFQGYRILGDDNVTANEHVANSYLSVTKDLCIPTSPAKTMIGKVFSFASQYFLGKVNISPLSMKEEMRISLPAQRVEFALRALRRGWCSGANETYVKMSMFLRSLLRQQDYVQEIQNWNKGMLGKTTQMALITSLATSVSLLEKLGYQDTGCETLLLAIANRVEALGGNQGQFGKGFEEPLVEFNIQFAISVLKMVTDEAKRACESLASSGQYWTEWWRGITQTGFLPRSCRLSRNFTTIPNVPYEHSPYLKIKKATKSVNTEIGFVQHNPPEYIAKYYPDIFFSEEFAMRTGQVYRKRSQRYVVSYTSALERISLLHQAFWPVIEEVFTPIFGDPTMDLESFPVYIGKTPDGNQRFGYAEAGWKTEVSSVSLKLNELMNQALEVDQTDRASAIVTVWRLVGEALDVMVGVSRPPNFHSLDDLTSDRRPDEVKFGVDWVRRTQAIFNILKVLPLEHVVPTGPRKKFVSGSSQIQGTTYQNK
jgi:hypothetical protein